MVPLKMGILDLADELLRIILEYVASEVEEEKYNRFLLWFGHKKVLLTALVSLFFVVGSIFVVFS